MSAFDEAGFLGVLSSHQFTLFNPITGNLAPLSDYLLNPNLTILPPQHFPSVHVQVHFNPTHVRVFLWDNWNYSSFYTPSDLDSFLTCLMVLHG